MKRIAGQAKSILLDKPLKEFDLIVSRSVETEAIGAVCLALGPYRNLTTLTASLLFLHPDCHVLNHAGRRIFGDRRLDFIGSYSAERFGRFVQYALHISRNGRRGNYGGSITRAHAFADNQKMRELLPGRGMNPAKECGKALFWKESLRTSNSMRNMDTDLKTIFKDNHKLRFLMPVRNPMDCAASNFKTGHARIFPDPNAGASVENTLKSVLDEIIRFKDLEVRYPDRFFHYFEYDDRKKTLERMASFLGLQATEDWIADSLQVFEINAGYEHSAGLVSLYREYVERECSRHPDFAERLLRFSPGQGGK